MDEEHVDISVDEEERWLDFVESGMHFRYEKNRTYLIEKTTLYNTLRNKRIKTVECVVIKGKYLFFIEAKTTAPNPQGEKGLERFNAFIEEIFLNLFILFNYAMRLLPIFRQRIREILINRARSFWLDYTMALVFVFCLL